MQAQADLAPLTQALDEQQALGLITAVRQEED